MLNHENIYKYKDKSEKEIKVSKSEDDLTIKSLYSLDKEFKKLEAYKHAKEYDESQRRKNTNVNHLDEYLSKIENEEYEKQKNEISAEVIEQFNLEHSEQNRSNALKEEIVKSHRRSSESRRLIYMPQKAALVPSFANSFKEKLNSESRARELTKKNGDLFQKRVNAEKLKVSRQTTSRHNLSEMEKYMEIRKGKNSCKDNEVYRDLAQFIGAYDSSLNDEDKIKLLDYYLGVSQKKGPEDVEGKDTAKALDIMTRALFAINIPALRLDSDSVIANKAGTFESILGQVTAYENMLKRYEHQDKDGKTVSYFDGIEAHMKNVIENHINKLRLISLYYITRRDIMLNNVYNTHRDDEITLNIDDNATSEQKNLAQSIMESYVVGKKLMQVAGASEKDLREIGNIHITRQAAVNLLNKSGELVNDTEASREKQREMLQNSFNSMNYIAVNGLGVYTSKAVRSDTTISAMFTSFDRLYLNGRLFGMNSYMARIIKNHIADVKKIFTAPLSNLGEYGGKYEALLALKELHRVCLDYKSKKIINEPDSLRQRCVVDILKLSRYSYTLLSNMSDTEFLELTKNKKDQSLFDILKNSDHVTDYKEEESEHSKLNILRLMHYDLVPFEYNSNITRESAFSPFGARLRNISILLSKKIGDEKEFKKNKREIKQELNSGIRLANEYLLSKPTFDSAIKRHDVAGLVKSYCDEMLSRLSKINYAPFKHKDPSAFSWHNVIFGEDVITMVEINNDGNSKIVDRKNMEYNFAETDEAKTEYKYANAVSFVAGNRSLCRDYKDTTVKMLDGTTKIGISYSNRIFEKHDEYNNSNFYLLTGSEIEKQAKDNGLNVIYSENALKQLSAIRIIDALFGKSTRALNTLMYNARTQLVFGEETIVINSCMSINNDGFFGIRKNAPVIAQNNGKVNFYDVEHDEKIVDENGKLTLGAYDRELANRIISLSPKECLVSFEKSGIVLNEEQKEAFTQRYNVIKNAFINDKKDKNGFAYNAEKEQEEERDSQIKKNKRWIKMLKKLNPGAARESAIAKSNNEINYYKNISIIDAPEIYRQDAFEKNRENKDLGLIIPAFISEYKTADNNDTLEEINKTILNLEKNHKKNPAVYGKQLIVAKAKKKLLTIKKRKDSFKSVSDRYRLNTKNKFFNIVNPILEGKDKKYAPEFIAILNKFMDYSKMDVSCDNHFFDVDYTRKAPSFNETDFIKEAELLNEAVSLTENRLKNIPDDTSDASLLFEKNKLTEIKNIYTKMMSGRLKVPKGQDTVFNDSKFIGINLNRKNESVKNRYEYTFLSQKDIPLFAHEPCANDMAQNGLGDCYLLSCMAGLVDKNPEYIKSMMKDNGNGTVTVRFYKNGNPVFITVDKSIPVRSLDPNDSIDNSLYVRGALWIKMIEKAFAASGLYKEMHSYSNKNYHVPDFKVALSIELEKENKVSFDYISGGMENYLLPLLTGKQATKKYIESEYNFDSQIGKAVLKTTKDEEEFIQQLRSLKTDKTKFMTLSSEQEFDPGKGVGLRVEDRKRGVFIHHVYSVMGLETINGEEFVVLKNPHGIAENDFLYNENTGAIINVSSDSQRGLLFYPLKQVFKMFRSYCIGKI